MASLKDEWLKQLRAEIPELSPEDLLQILQARGEPVALFDVRETDEYRQGSIPGARHLPRGFIELEAASAIPGPDHRVVAFCQSGMRSLFAAEQLRRLGFKNVTSLAGGFTRWKQGGHPFEVPASPIQPGDRAQNGLGAGERSLPAATEALPAPAARSSLQGPGRRVAVDVREAPEYRAGHVAEALHVPRGFLELQAEQKLPLKDRPLLVYCSDGRRSRHAAGSLRRLGYSDVVVLEGGLRAWEAAGFDVEVPEGLTDRERERYMRHVTIEEVGEPGQLKLKKARVLCIGAGGLGSPAAYYLAAAGVGTLGLVDYDVVDRSNLQRQILHAEDRLGMLKTESAKKTLLGLNPDIRVIAHNERLTSENVDAIFGQYDLILDGCDNFPTRYLVNDACVKHRKPNVHGSIYRFEGQVTVFWPGKGPCYRCLYPEPPPPELAPSCAEAGVLGVLPGVIGVLEAIEAIKIILGKGHVLAGRLLTYDALEARFRELKLRRDPGCAYCGDGKDFPGYTDYAFFCGV